MTEPNPSSGSLTSGAYPTTYGYNLLNNLTSVAQTGDGSGTRARSFVFDSLSRLTSAQNPESGTVAYTYDSESSICKASFPGDLVKRTDARGTSTCYGYDQLHRLTAKAYNDGTTAPSWFYYDESSIWGVHPQNAIGRLSHSAGSGAAATVFSYDAMGRIVQEWPCTPSICGQSSYPFSLGYDLAGHQTSLTYPSGRQVTENYTGAGRLLSVNFASFNGTAVNYPYFTAYQNSSGNPGYHPNGAGRISSDGNNVWEYSYLNSRLYTDELRIVQGSTNQDYSKRFYSYSESAFNNGNAGNVAAITDALSNARTQNFQYDYLSRLTSAYQNDNSFNQTFSPDPWGNLSQSGTAGSGGAFGTANQLGGSQIGSSCTQSTIIFCYDQSGNMTWDTAHSYGYDAESRISTVDSGVTYTYDADGDRVRKDVSGSDPTEYIYFNGKPISEYDPNTGTWTDYIYGNSGKLARATGSTSSGTYYYHRDHLGSTRLITDSNGNVVSNCTYMPFGELVSCSPSASWNHYGFTGDEHDNESNLEHTMFRQLSSVQGRWLSPDPAGIAAADLTNPQSLNLYAYVNNNPINAVDPLGLACKYAITRGGGGCDMPGLNGGEGDEGYPGGGGGSIDGGEWLPSDLLGTLGGLGEASFLSASALGPCNQSIWDGNVYCGSGDNIVPYEEAVLGPFANGGAGAASGTSLQLMLDSDCGGNADRTIHYTLLNPNGSRAYGYAVIQFESLTSRAGPSLFGPGSSYQGAGEFTDSIHVGLGAKATNSIQTFFAASILGNGKYGSRIPLLVSPNLNPTPYPSPWAAIGVYINPTSVFVQGTKGGGQLSNCHPGY